MSSSFHRILAARLLLAAAGAIVLIPAQARPASAPLPDWEHLSEAQRELLVEPLRQRWNDEPEQRARIYDHARRWQQMTPQQRERARDGARRFEHMSPEQRRRARQIFDHIRDLPADQRRQWMHDWQNMSPEQREDWLRSHPPRERDRP